MSKATIYEQLPAVKAPEIEIYYKTTAKAGQRFKVLTCQDIFNCHNHPSGNTSPSQADRRLTERIGQAAALFGVKLIDSVIITTTNYFSFAAEGIL